MEKFPVAINGVDWRAAQSFTVTLAANTSSAEIVLTQGGYELRATADTDVTVAAAGQGAATVVPNGAPQPASPNGKIRLFANAPRKVDIAAGTTIRAISVPGGTLEIYGPVRPGTNY